MGARRWTVALDGYLIPIGGGREREVYDDGEQVVLAADHDRIVVEAEARGWNAGARAALQWNWGHYSDCSTITGGSCNCEIKGEIEESIAALRKPEVEG